MKMGKLNSQIIMLNHFFRIRQYPSLFTDQHGDKRSQGCELCEGGDGYPYYFVCQNGDWNKIYCDNSTFCTETGRCTAECLPCKSSIVFLKIFYLHVF